MLPKARVLCTSHQNYFRDKLQISKENSGKWVFFEQEKNSIHCLLRQTILFVLLKRTWQYYSVKQCNGRQTSVCSGVCSESPLLGHRRPYHDTVRTVEGSVQWVHFDCQVTGFRLRGNHMISFRRQNQL